MIIAPQGSNEQSLGLSWVLRTLLARRLFLASVIVLGIIASTIYALSVTPQYQATTRILVEDLRPQIASGQEIVRQWQVDGNVTMLGQVIASQVALIQSPQLLRKVVSQLKLFEASEPSKLQRALSWLNLPFPLGIISGPPKLGKLEDLKKSDRKLKKFKSRLSVRRLNPTSIILVSYLDSDRQRAAQVANAVAEAYIAERSTRINKVKKGAVGWLKARATELREQLQVEERALEEYKERNNLVAVDGQLVVEREVVRTLERLTESRAEAAGLQARAEFLSQLVKKPEELIKFAMAQSPMLVEYRRQSLELLRRLSQASSRLGQDHQDVRGLRDELEQLREQIREEAARLVSAGHKEAQVAALRASIQEEDLRNRLSKLVATKNEMIQLRELERHYHATRDVYAAVLSRLKESEVQSSLETSQSHVVSYASAPLEPDRPRKSVILIFGTFGSAWLAISLILVYDFYSGIIRSPGDVSRNLKCLAKIPRLTRKQLKKQWPADRDELNDWIVIGDMRSRYEQTVFKLWNSVDKAGSAGKLFGIMSPRKGNGKTITTLNLAKCAVEAGKKVLLIDADLRGPDLTKRYYPHPKVSMFDIANGEAGLGDAISKGYFDFCPGPDGLKLERPLSALTSEGVTRFFSEARMNYDLILVDTSAMLDYADAGVLLDALDAMILILECNRTKKTEVDELFETAGGDSVKCIGFVLNMTG